MNNYNLHQTGNNHYCDCCLKDIDIDKVLFFAVKNVTQKKKQKLWKLTT